MNRARRLVDALRALQPPKKALGQHFLVLDEVLEATVAWAEVNSDDHVLEVGPGPGVLTEALLATGCTVTAIELDEGACEHLKRAFSEVLGSGQLTLLEGDALAVNWPNGITKVVANIPYQISSPLIDRITKAHRHPHSEPLEQVVLLVQEEFAERVVMEYESDVGSLGMVVALDFDADMGMRVGPHAFSPMPKIHSRLLKLVPHDEDWPCDRRLLVMMIQQAFAERRKKLRSTLKRPPKRLGRVPGWHASRWRTAYEALVDDERMEQRPEVFELDDWVELGMAFTEVDNKA